MVPSLGLCRKRIKISHRGGSSGRVGGSIGAQWFYQVICAQRSLQSKAFTAFFSSQLSVFSYSISFSLRPPWVASPWVATFVCQRWVQETGDVVEGKVVECEG